MKRREFIRTAGLGGVLLSLSTIIPSCAKKSQPNFVIIFADDMGWDDLSFNGNKIIETPNLDNFAENSVRFSKYYVNPVCAPSRASLLTGRHFLRTGVSHVNGGKDYLNLNEITIAEELKDKGYKTGMWGKWHSGGTDGYLPWQRGFDESYKAKLYQHRNSYGKLNGKHVEHKKWGTEVIVDYALDFMKTNQPFFAYLSLMNCHSPLDAPEKLVEKYTQKGLSRNLSILYAMIDFMDSQIGRLLSEMDKRGLRENTIVMFFSDNGPAVNNGLLTDEDRKIRYVNKLKGHKGNTWENGVRSNLFINWPDKFQSNEVKRLVDICDIYPTILDFAGITKGLSKSLDGRSIKEYLYGNTESLTPKLSFNYANPGWPPSDKPWTPEGIKDEYRPVPKDKKAEILKYDEQIISVQNEKYKLLKNPGTVIADLVDGYALFDIDNDPMQLNNIIRDNLKISREMKGQLKSWWKSILDEETSFQMPIFQIGGEKQSKVYAYGAWDQSSNIKTTISYTTNWIEVNDFTEYKLNVLNAGKYKITLNHESTIANKAKMRLTIDNQTITFNIDQDKSMEIGDIVLQKGIQDMRLELVDLHGAKKSVFDKLFSFIFEKI